MWDNVGNEPREENESIREKNRQAAARAWKNMKAALDDREEYEGINAVLKFFHEKERLESGLMLSEQLKILEERFFIRTRYVELDQDWYRTAAGKDGRRAVAGGDTEDRWDMFLYGTGQKGESDAGKSGEVHGQCHVFLQGTEKRQDSDEGSGLFSVSLQLRK